MPKFRKKPVVIDAVQFDGTRRGCDVIEKWADRTFGFDCAAETGELRYRLWIPTLEGGHYASPGDWIIRGVQDELYPCKPDIFAKTYDPVEPADAGKENVNEQND